LPDYYVELVEIARKYIGSTAEYFVRAVLRQIGASPATVSKEHIKAFAEEIPIAAGKALSQEQKNSFAKEVLKLAG